MEKKIYKIILAALFIPSIIIILIYYGIFLISHLFSIIFNYNIPNWMLKIDFSQSINIKDFMAQYFAIIGIEVTGILSYAIYELTKESFIKREEEVFVKFIVALKEVLEELEKWIYKW